MPGVPSALPGLQPATRSRYRSIGPGWDGSDRWAVAPWPTASGLGNALATPRRQARLCLLAVCVSPTWTRPSLALPDARRWKHCLASFGIFACFFFLFLFSRLVPRLRCAVSCNFSLSSAGLASPFSTFPPKSQSLANRPITSAPRLVTRAPPRPARSAGCARTHAEGGPQPGRSLQCLPGPPRPLPGPTKATATPEHRRQPSLMTGGYCNGPHRGAGRGVPPADCDISIARRLPL